MVYWKPINFIDTFLGPVLWVGKLQHCLCGSMENNQPTNQHNNQNHFYSDFETQ